MMKNFIQKKMILIILIHLLIAINLQKDIIWIKIILNQFIDFAMNLVQNVI